MAKQIPNYKKLTVTSVSDPSSGGYDIHSYERDVRGMINNAVKSALSEGEFFTVGARKVDPKTGEMKIDIYVHEDREGITEASLLQEAKSFKGGTIVKYDVSRSKMSEEERKAIAEEERARNKEDTETTRYNKGMLLKLAGLLVTIADITRRILTGVMANAKQTVSDAVTAHNLGVSTEDIRHYRYVERAHGLKEDTFTGALSTVQNWFGNITKLDETALSDLALIMGGEIEKMATMGLGSSDPEKIVEAIINAFNQRASEGKTSAGVYVGEQEARRELYSYLLRLSPEMASIFAKMQEEQNNINSIYRNFKDYTDWKNIIDNNRGNFPQQYLNVEVTTGELANKVDSIFEQIKQGLKLNLDPLVVAILRKISNLRWGLSASENAEMNRKNNESNQSYLNFLNKTLAGMEGEELTPARKGLKVTLEKEKNKVEKEIALYGKGKDVADMARTISELEVEGVSNTQAILAFDAIGSDYKSEESRKLIKRAIDERLPASTIQEARDKITQGEEVNLRNRKLAEKKKLYKELYDKYKASGMTYGEIYDAIIAEHPELLQKRTVKKRFFGKEYESEELVWAYKDLTDEEAREIKQQASENVTEEDLYDYLFRKFGNKLNIGAYQIQEAREQIKNTPEASLMALYALGDAPDAWQKKIGSLPVKNTYDYNVIGMNTRNKSGEVIHKIILDVNANGELDKEDKVLGEFLGYEGYNGLIGVAHANVEGKNVVWDIETTGTEASVENKLVNGD